MPRFVKRIADGFLFGVGFSLATVTIFGVIALLGASFLFKQGFGAMSDLFSETETLEKAEGVFLVSSNLVRRDSDIVITAVLTNSTETPFKNLTAYTQLDSRNGSLVDFSHDSLPGLNAHSQRDITIVFQMVDSTNSVEDLSFQMKIYE